jgi:hypothetical protein
MSTIFLLQYGPAIFGIFILAIIAFLIFAIFKYTLIENVFIWGILVLFFISPIFAVCILCIVVLSNQD